MPAKTEREIEQGKSDQRERISTDNWTIRLTVATAFILALQLIVFGVQAHRLKQSIDEARRATEATRLAASAAEQTVATMNLTARRDLRAYVAISTGTIDQMDENGHPRAKLMIKNYGKTPAYRLAVSATIEFHAAGDALREPQEPGTVSGHLAPGASLEMNVEAGWVLNTGWRHQVQNRIGAVHVYGVIRYIDTYGIPRFTRYRLMTDGRSSVPSGRLISSASGNDTDDDAEIAAAAARNAQTTAART